MIMFDPNSVRSQYVGKSITHLKSQGRANPITYII